MKLRMPGLCMAIFLFAFTNTFCQDKSGERSPVKFGQVAAADFDLSKYNFDTSVSAVVISDVGSSSFEGNSKGWFTLVYKHQERIKILNKNGFDAARIEIPLYSNGSDEEKIADLKAFTYNLENGQVVKTALDDKSVFKDKLSKNLVEKKFTFPAVKEGSIIEYSYTINSDFLFNLQPWPFQGDYPRIWSEYNVGMPEFFNYVILAQGYQPFYINNRSESFKSYAVTRSGGVESDEHINVSAPLHLLRWVMKDVPALKEENFTSTIKNHVAKLEFQLSQYRFPDQPVEEVMGNWFSVTDSLLKRENFGEPLSKDNNWLNDDMKTIVAGTSDPLQKATLIYAYLRDHFTCTDFSDMFLNNPLKTIFKNKSGSVSDINLLLVAMLRHENIEAYPMILSTRGHGFARADYPLMHQYNYVIAEAAINGTSYFLDASQPLLGFGKLPLKCYNGYARRIAQPPVLTNLVADSLKEGKVTSVIITAEKGKLTGSFQSTLGYYESLGVRERIKDKGEADFYKKLKAGYTNDIEIDQPGIDSLQSKEDPVTIHYDFKINDMDGNIIYLNPMMAEGYKDNPFKAAERKYPVEMPYTFDETYILTMDIPKDYVVDEIPKSAKVTYNDGEGMFEYMISKSESGIQLRSRLMIKRANFNPDDYNSLRDFFGYIVKKHSEQIVLKKKK